MSALGVLMLKELFIRLSRSVVLTFPAISLSVRLSQVVPFFVEPTIVTSVFSLSSALSSPEKTRKHELLVEDIIKREDFTVKFIYDTFEMDNEQELLIQDASPIILNSETFEMFPIGIFISVAEKINLSSTFDRILIEFLITLNF